MGMFFYITLPILLLAGCSPKTKNEHLEKMLGKATELFDEGYSTEALPYGEEALEYSIRHFGEMSTETAVISKKLAYIFYEKRMFGSARKEYSRLIRILNTVPGERKSDLIEAYQKLSKISSAFKDIEGALEISKLVLEHQQQFLGQYHEDTLDTCMRLARLHSYIKKENGIHIYIDKGIQTIEHIHGENTTEAIKYLKMKLRVADQMKNVDVSISTLEKLITISRKHSGDISIPTAEYLNLYADALIKRNDLDNSLKSRLEAYEINKKLLSKSSPVLINNCRQIALTKLNLDDHASMEKYLLEAIELASVDTLNNDILFELVQSLADYYVSSQDFAKAEVQLKKVLDLRKEKLGEFHPDLIFDLNSLAGTYIEQQKYIKAQEILEEGYNIVSHTYGKLSEYAMKQIDLMALLSYKAKKYPQAITKCEEAISSLSEVYPNTHALYLPFYQRLSLIFKTTNNFTKATDFSLKALKVSEFNYGNESALLVVDLSLLVDLYTLRKMPTEAISFAERSVQILEQSKNTNILDLAAKLNDLATLYETTGDKTKAEALYKKSRELYSRKKAP